MQEAIADSIERKVRDQLGPSELVLLNESHRHAGPATDSHFNLTLVSSAFEGLPVVRRHQLVYRILAEEMAGPVHALALHLYTPEEWGRRGKLSPDSPECAGKNK